MDDIPWLYVAMIFIAFVSWIFNQVKDAAQVRREKLAEKKRAQRARMSTEAEYESPYRQSERPSRETVPEGPKSFRDIFAEIERQINEVEEEPARVPPPLPRTQETPVVPVATVDVPHVADVSGLGTFPGATSGKKRRKKRNLDSNRETSAALRRTLRDGHQLKNALILKEILGPPRAQQPRLLRR